MSPRVILWDEQEQQMITETALHLLDDELRKVRRRPAFCNRARLELDFASHEITIFGDPAQIDELIAKIAALHKPNAEDQALLAALKAADQDDSVLTVRLKASLRTTPPRLVQAQEA